MMLMAAFIVTALAVTAFAAMGADDSSAEGGTVAIPTAKEGLKYNSTEQTGVAEGEGYTLTDNKATNAGNYTATATLKDGYVWSDNSTGPMEIPWSIAKGELTNSNYKSSSIQYGESLPEIELKFEGTDIVFKGNYTVAYDTTQSGNFNLDKNKVKNVGNYYGKVTVEDQNVNSPGWYFTFSITAINLCDCRDDDFNISPSGEITYDGNKHPVSSVTFSKDSVYETINESVTIYYSKDGSDYTENVPVDAGTYSIKITAKSGSNYNETKELKNVLKILPKTVTVSVGDVIDAMNNNNTFADPSLDNDLKKSNCRIVVKENKDYTVTYNSSSSKIVLSDDNKTTSADTAEKVSNLCSNITFNINNENAEGSMSDTVALKSYDLPECGYTAKGMHFAGWSLTPDGEIITTESISVTEKNVTLYAIWEATEGTISSESTSYKFAADNVTTGDIEVVLKEGKTEYTLTFAKGENVGGKTVSVTLNTAKTAENVTAYEINTDGITNFSVKLPCQKGFGTASVLCDGSSEGVSKVYYNSEEGYVTFTSNHNSLFTITLSGTSASVPSSGSESYAVTSSQTEGEDYSLIIAFGALLLSLAFLAVVLRR